MADGKNLTAELKKCNKAHFSQVKLMFCFLLYLPCAFSSQMHSFVFFTQLEEDLTPVWSVRAMVWLDFHGRRLSTPNLSTTPLKSWA